jgi:protein KRI1
MAGTKEKKHANGVKRQLTVDERPAKKAKLLDNTDDEDSDNDAGGASLKVNEDYARRFEYNKKREEQHRCMFGEPVILSHY